MKRYTLKKDGKYYTGDGASGRSFVRGFTAIGIGACYSYSLDEARELQKQVGGEIVEVVRLGRWSYAEGEVLATEPTMAEVAAAHAAGLRTSA